MRYGFFPGCSLESTAWDYDRSTRALCETLGIGLTDVPDWVCCGSTPAHASNASLAVALPVLNLQKARDGGLPEVLTACASCYARLRTANHKVTEDPAERERASRLTGHPYAGEVKVRHILDVLHNDVGVKEIRKRVQAPLQGLRVASYYGCLLSRPKEVVAFDDPEHPTCMDELVEAAGAVPVDWPLKTECCGASLSVSNSLVVNRLGRRILSMARRAGADCIVVACTLCQLNLDFRQPEVIGKGQTVPEIPVLYITQLLGLALGLPEKSLGMSGLTVSPSPVTARCAAGQNHRRR